jgi:hypothetical protein
MAQAATAASAGPLSALDFLVGTWSAQSNAATGSAGASASGDYTFRRDLAGHALERVSTSASCKAPSTFDCQHTDKLIIFGDPGAQSAHHSSLLALYLDSEGHVIYYTISTPDPHTAVFDSQAAVSAPHFRLIYHLEGSGPNAIMSGKFQTAAPGSQDFHSYLEWSGTRR